MNYPKVPIDRVRSYNNESWSCIPELRRQMKGKVPNHGAPDGPIPAMTAITIACKQIVHFLSYTGRWPK